MTQARRPRTSASRSSRCRNRRRVRVRPRAGSGAAQRDPTSSRCAIRYRCGCRRARTVLCARAAARASGRAAPCAAMRPGRKRVPMRIVAPTSTSFGRSQAMRRTLRATSRLSPCAASVVLQQRNEGAPFAANVNGHARSPQRTRGGRGASRHCDERHPVQATEPRVHPTEPRAREIALRGLRCDRESVRSRVPRASAPLRARCSRSRVCRPRACGRSSSVPIRRSKRTFSDMISTPLGSRPCRMRVSNASRSSLGTNCSV